MEYWIAKVGTSSGSGTNRGEPLRRRSSRAGPGSVSRRANPKNLCSSEHPVEERAIEVEGGTVFEGDPPG